MLIRKLESICYIIHRRKTVRKKNLLISPTPNLMHTLSKSDIKMRPAEQKSAGAKPVINYNKL